MNRKYYISPFVIFRSLSGELVADVEDATVSFQGPDLLLLSALCAPRTPTEVADLLATFGLVRSAEEVEESVHQLVEIGLLVFLESVEKYTHEQDAAQATLYASRVLRYELGHDESFDENGLSAPRDGSGRPMPIMPYPVAHWLKGYDLTDKNVLVTTGGAFEWWSESFAKVFVIKRASLERLNLSVFDKGNVELVDTWPSTGPFDLIELVPKHSHYATRALRLVSKTGCILLRHPEWTPEALKVLRNSDLIEINVAGLQPNADAPRGCSIFLSRRFDWKPLTPTSAPIPIGGVKRPDDLPPEKAQV